MNDDKATVAIPNDVLKPIIESRIQAAIVTALGGERELIASAVTAALTQKVTAAGKTSQYSSENKYTLLEVLMRDAVIGAARTAITKFLEEQHADIEKAVLKHLTSRRNPLAKALVEGLSKAIQNTWTFQIRLQGFEDK